MITGPDAFAAGTEASWAAARSSLFTDLYQLLMVQLYHRRGLADRTAQFDYFFRSNPDYGTHQAGFSVTVGHGPLWQWMRAVRFDEPAIAALAELRDPKGNHRFSPEFLEWLGATDHFAALQIKGIEEGRVVHPHVPVLTVTGPLAAAQLLETPLLNFLNYPSLIATKAARIARVAQGSPVLEFGMRRGPALGAGEAVRGALIGGCASTSDVEAAVVAGIEPAGTHGHSLVQAYLATSPSAAEGELEAFRAFADLYPDACLLLVDTIDTLRSGIPHAITVFRELRERGHEPVGIRLDSGDLAYLAVRAAEQLDAVGFETVSIVLSGDLDELTIWQIQTQIDEDAPRFGIAPEALKRRLVYGVGTRLITSHGDPSFNGVYKLVGLEDETGEMVPAVKLSENPAKVPIPGPKQVWRLYDTRGVAVVDLVAAPDEDPLATELVVTHHPYIDGMVSSIERSQIMSAEPLLGPLDTCGSETLGELRVRCRADIERLDPGVRRLVNPHVYHVSLSEQIWQRQQATIARARSGSKT